MEWLNLSEEIRIFRDDLKVKVLVKSGQKDKTSKEEQNGNTGIVLLCRIKHDVV